MGILPVSQSNLQLTKESKLTDKKLTELSQKLSSEDQKTKRAGRDALRRCIRDDQVKAAQWIIGLIENGHTEARRIAAQMTRRLDSIDSTLFLALTKSLNASAEAHVVHEAAISLMHHGYSAPNITASALHAIEHGQYWQVRVSAISVASEHLAPTIDSYSLLHKVAKSENGQVSNAAIDALARMGYRAATQSAETAASILIHGVDSPTSTIYTLTDMNECFKLISYEPVVEETDPLLLHPHADEPPTHVVMPLGQLAAPGLDLAKLNLWVDDTGSTDEAIDAEMMLPELARITTPPPASTDLLVRLGHNYEWPTAIRWIKAAWQFAQRPWHSFFGNNYADHLVDESASKPPKPGRIKR